MKVNFSPITNFFKNRRIDNPQTKANIVSSPASDTFVKSAENMQVPSFSHFNDKYPNLKKEMTEYIMKSPELSLDKIRQITQKYSPNVDVDDMKHSSSGTNINYSTDAYTFEPVSYEERNGKLRVSELPKTVYLNFGDDDYKNDRNKRIILLGSTLHEFTHVFQSSSDDRTSLFTFAQNFCDKTKSISEAMPTLKSFNPIFNYTSFFMLKALATAVPSIGELPKEINRRKDIDSCFMDKYKMNSFSFAKNLLNTVIARVMAQEQNIDKNAILDYSIIKSQHEAEAYQNSLDSNKEQLGISGKTDFDLRIELYNSIVKAAESLKDSQNAV